MQKTNNNESLGTSLELTSTKNMMLRRILKMKEIQIREIKEKLITALNKNK